MTRPKIKGAETKLEKGTGTEPGAGTGTEPGKSMGPGAGMEPGMKSGTETKPGTGAGMKTLTQTPGQVLQTPRLVLRPWREDDAEALYELARNPEIGPRAGWPVHTDVENSLQIIRGVLSAPETYAIVVIESGELVGSIGLLIGSASNLGLPADEAEVGYWVGQPFWGRGYAPEATRELMRRAFDDLGITTMWCGYFEGNDKSRRVGQKCGFGHRRAEEKHWPLIDRTVVQHITAITKQEYQNI